MYTGLFTEGTVAKMASKLKQKHVETVFNKLPSGRSGEFVCYTFSMVHMNIIK